MLSSPASVGTPLKPKRRASDESTNTSLKASVIAAAVAPELRPPLQMRRRREPQGPPRKPPYILNQDAYDALLAARSKPDAPRMSLLEYLARQHNIAADGLMERLGWKPHTLRAAISRLRDKGYRISAVRIKGCTTYWLAWPSWDEDIYDPLPGWSGWRDAKPLFVDWGMARNGTKRAIARKGLTPEQAAARSAEPGSDVSEPAKDIVSLSKPKR